MADQWGDRMNVRDDIELLAKELCRAHETGLASGRICQPHINKMVQAKWKDWIPQATKTANKVYGQLFESCQNAYRKHVMEDEDIGWEDLSDQLSLALVSIMGEDEYDKWLDNTDKREKKNERSRK